MTTVNNLTLIGYVGANPEIRYMTDGGATTTVSIATSDQLERQGGSATVQNGVASGCVLPTDG